MTKSNYLRAVVLTACLFLVTLLLSGSLFAQATISAEKLAAFKRELMADIDKEKVFTPANGRHDL